MGRPRKDGMDYFPHDTDAAGDEKLDAFRTFHGNDAYAFYFILCERIYRTPTAELNITNPVIVASLARRIMLPVDRFQELLRSALELHLFSPDEYAARGVLTSQGIKKRVAQIEIMRDRWRQNKATKKGKDVFSEENPGIPLVFHPQRKVKESKAKEIKTNNTHTHAAIQAPQPFADEGNLDVWKALVHYQVKTRGFLNIEKIVSFQGVLSDDLILAAIKESGGQSDAYCLKILESWHQKGWIKLEDHPKYRQTEGGGPVVVESRRRRNQGQWDSQRNATSSAFEEAGKRSKPGKQVYAPKE